MARMKKGWTACILIFLALSWWGGCTHVYTAHGAYYRVRRGDTIESIARRYHTSVQDLAEVNNIESSEEVKVGTSLYIPGITPSRFAAILKKEGIEVSSVARKETQVKTAKKSKPPSHVEGPETAESDEGESPKSETAIKTDRGRFVWPVEGEVSSLFGMRRGRRHDGIDIRAQTGTPVYAAKDGEVVYAKRMRGYGNLVLLKHEEDFFTVYAHNSVNLVKVGMKVKKGQMISRVGRTGRATGPHLHFEVREGAKSRNPLFFLPKTMYAEKAKNKKNSDYGGPDEAGETDYAQGDSDGETQAENP